MRRIGIFGIADIIGRAADTVRAELILRTGEHHECPTSGDFIAGAGDAVRTSGDQRVVSFEGNKYGAAALDRLVDPVVEELTEKGEQGVLGRRQSNVGGDIWNKQGLAAWNAIGRNADDWRVSQRVGVDGAREFSGVAL